MSSIILQNSWHKKRVNCWAYTTTNDIAERKNRTIVKMAHSTPQSKNLTKSFWAKAVNTAVYILNGSPTKAVLDMTPYGARHKRKPKAELSILKYLAALLIPTFQKQIEKNWMKRGKKCIFIGYSDESKGYRLYKPETKQLIISRDVIFDEMQAWQWSNDATQGPRVFTDAGDSIRDVQSPSSPQSSPGPSSPRSSS